MPEPHVHFSGSTVAFIVAVVILFMGTAHLAAVSQDNRISRAFVALGF